MRLFLQNFVMKFLILPGLIFLACGHSPERAEDALIFWSANNVFEQQFAREVVAEWNRLHPDKHVVHQPVPEGQSSEEVILASIAARTTPDIYANVWPGDVQFYVRANAVVRISDFPGALDFLIERSGADAIEAAKSPDGSLHHVPWKTNPIMMVYNVKLFRELGYDRAPATYREFIEAGLRLKAGNGVERWIGIADIRNIWWQRFFDFYSLYLAASGGVTLVRGDSVLFENEAAVRVMAFLQDVYRRGLFPKQKASAVGDLFLLGRIATRFTGPWTISHLERFKPEGFEYAFSPLPVPEKTDGPIYTYGDPKNIVIFSTCKRPQDAWAFIQFMLSRENDRRFLEITSQLPRRVGMTTDSLFADYFRRHPMMVQFAQQAHYVRGADQAPVMKEVFDAISQEYEAAVVYQVKSAEQAIRDAAARVRLILH